MPKNTPETLQTAIGAGIVTVPVEPWEKIHLTGEQFIALTSNVGVITSTDALAASLPFPLSIMLLPVFAEVRMQVLESVFTWDEAEVEDAIRKHCPEVTADYDKGESIGTSARNAVARAKAAGVVGAA